MIDYINNATGETEMTKTRKLYQVRREMGAGSSSKQVGRKMRLLDRAVAMRVVKRLKKSGVDAFVAPVKVAV